MNKALFLDRDGTIMYDRNYIADPRQVDLIAGAAEALSRAKNMGFHLFLFTNQSGVGRKYFTMDDVMKVNERMIDLLALPAPIFTDICIAPETSQEPQIYRKPSPRFIMEMISKHGLAADSCYMVGDANSDIMAGVNAGIIPIGLKGERLKLAELPVGISENLMVFPRLLDFVLHLEAGTLSHS